MNSAQHYTEAERLMNQPGNDGQRGRWTTEAGVHATLALVALVAEMSLEGDRNPLAEMTDGPKPLRDTIAWANALDLHPVGEPVGD